VQTFGDQFSLDGRPQGTYDVQTVQCDQQANTCAVKVPAPGFALVFLTESALDESTPTSVKTFATTAVTKLHNTATVDPQVLATSNGSSAKDRKLGGTSQGKTSGATAGRVGQAVSVSVLVLVSGGVLLKFWT
jgi:hypothetical protein